MHDVDILRLILSKRLARNGRESARDRRKKRRNGRGKKRVPPDPLALTVMLCCLVLKRLFFSAWSEQKALSEEKAPPCGLEFVGGMLFQSEPSQSFHRTFWYMHWLHSHFI